ncbi:MAG TPA: hypothetical protein PK230_11340, partial [Chitinophagales bacterium]|nr:hypothetical protein [Chitinophagales bacterium]
NGQNPYLTTCTVGNSGNEDFICIDQGASTTLSSASNWSIASYAWSNGATTPTITVSTPGTYTVTVTNSAGCTGTDRIVVKTPAVHVTVPDAVFCGEDTFGQNPLGYNLGYTTTGNTAIAQTWSNGITTPTTIIYPSGSGVYTVTVTAANGCTASDSGNIMVHDSPNPSMQSSNPPSNAFCSNTSIDLSTTTPYNSYTWVLDPTPPITPDEILGTSPTLHIDGATTGEGIRNVIVTDANGCTGYAALWLDHYPAPNVAMNTLVTDCATTLQLTTQGSNSFPVTWSTGATGTTSINTPATIGVNQAGVYTATASIVGIDFDGNPHTCTTTVQQTVSSNQIQPVDFSGDYIVGTTTPALGNRVGDIETWDSPGQLNSIRVAGKVIIPNGKRLVIKNSTTVEMVGENAGIDVAKNAVLFLKENSVLRGDACSNTCWRGVVVDGDWQVAHPSPTTYLTNGSTNHGIVRIETEGTIQDAKVAVASQSTYTSGGLTTTVAGGIIYASDANFRNNLLDIKMERQNATVAVAQGGVQRSVI